MSVSMQKAASPGAMTLQQALEEAHRCLLCHDAPCSSGCPGGTDPGTFIRQLRFLNFKGAARTILRNNPLGGVCARICPSETTCRAGCVRAGLDRPIDIDGLQRFAVEYGRKLGVTVGTPHAQATRKVAVVGAGPAGLTAASLLARDGYGVTLFDARMEAGGMLRYGIPEQRLPTHVLEEDLAELQQAGIEWRMGEAMTSQQAAQLLHEGYDAVFLAPGLWRARTLQIPGIDAQGVFAAVQFLEAARIRPQTLIPTFEGKDVAVIGGGSVAMDAATTALELGAKRVVALALEEQRQLPATQAELQMAWAIGVEIRPHSRVVKLSTHEGHVVGLEGVQTEWINPGSVAPENARDIPGTEFKLRVDVLVQAIGQKASAEMGGVLTLATATAQTPGQPQPGKAETGLFAGGDIVRGAGTVVEAVGDGKRAAQVIHDFLSAKEVQA